MTITLNGTTGISSPGGDTATVSLATPLISSPSSLTLQTNGSTTAVTIDTAQNVGIAVTPSAWNVSGRVLTIGRADINAQASLFMNGIDDFWATSNVYYNSGWLYKLTGTASWLHLGASGFYFNAADSGTAGTTATPLTILQTQKGYTLALQNAGISVGTGIAFPATQSASTDPNTLDDYEEGSWSPVFATDGTQPTYTPVSISGKYVKIGRAVYYEFYIYASGGATGGSGNVIVTGLPFQAATDSVRGLCSYLYWGSANKWTADGRNGIGWQSRVGTTQLDLYANSITYANGVVEIGGSGFYLAST